MRTIITILCITMCGIWAIAPRSVQAQPARPPAFSDTPVVVTGSVTAFKYTRRGEIDGFYLNDGTEVHFPKHRAWEVTQVVAVGSSVQVDGVQRFGRRGDIHVKAQVITNLTTNARVVIEEVVSVSGQIQNYTYSPSGRIDGFILSTGDVVKVPRHMSALVSSRLPIGTPVQVDGVRKIGKYGDVHIDPDTITNLTTGEVVVIP
ncbi:MAG: hypothetical protein KatS3mg055_0043 [Chloroflexus sp.]|uniref:hypothetical protein n=1 Tax=Chloroflexus sp. TaxID=1904827 RepID=UPI0021DD29ED|nr:hypothetical protein [Chloroflexus sp.]GIV87525.1 MAG: hypothetical protein KatS3mg055_0043 [Chloroflexus sp.]